MAAGLFICFAILVVFKVPIAIALSGAALFSVAVFTNIQPFVIAQRLFASTDSFSMMAIPFFMIAGGLMARGGVSKRLVNFANSIVGSVHGGLAMVSIVASAFFGALSGSSTATVAAIGTLLIPSMLEAGYSRKFTLATVATAGFLGVIIPPSIPMISYGIGTGASIGDLFLAGFLPGIILACGMCVVAYIYGKKNVPVTQKFAWSKVISTFKDAIWALLMPVIILGGIYGGIFTPTESACVASFYGLFVGVVVYKELKFKDFYAVMLDSVVSTGMIMFIVAAAGAFGFLMTREMIPVKVAQFILGISNSPVVFLLLINIMLLIVGTFMETNAAILILAPMLLPIVNQMGINVVHFGIIMIVNLAIGMVTPPLGVNMFVAAGILGTSVDEVVNKHLITYILVCIGILLVFTYVPAIILAPLSFVK